MWLPIACALSCIPGLCDGDPEAHRGVEAGGSSKPSRYVVQEFMCVATIIGTKYTSTSCNTRDQCAEAFTLFFFIEICNEQHSKVYNLCDNVGQDVAKCYLIVPKAVHNSTFVMMLITNSM